MAVLAAVLVLWKPSGSSLGSRNFSMKENLLTSQKCLQHPLLGPEQACGVSNQVPTTTPSKAFLIKIVNLGFLINSVSKIENNAVF